MSDMSGAESCSLAQVLSCDFPCVLSYPGVWSITQGDREKAVGPPGAAATGQARAPGMSAAAGLWSGLGPRRGGLGWADDTPDWGALGANSKPHQSASHTPTAFGNQDVHRRAGFLGRRSKGASCFVARDLD